MSASPQAPTPPDRSSPSVSSNLGAEGAGGRRLCGSVVLSAGKILSVDKTLWQALGLSAESLSGLPFLSFLEDPSREVLAARLRLAGPPWDLRTALRVDGRAIPVVLRGDGAADRTTDTPLQVILITLAPQEGEVEPVSQSALFDHIPLGVMLSDGLGRIAYANPAFLAEDIAAVRALLGATPQALATGYLHEGLARTLWEDLLCGRVWRNDVDLPTADGQRTHSRLTIIPLRRDDGAVDRLMTVIEPRSPATDSQAWQQVNHDTLTGLPNRVLFQDRLLTALASARRRNDQLAVLFVDLDHFKTVNDSLGHSFGDQLLQQVATRLSQCLRDSDTLARMGGDEFTIALTGDGHQRDYAMIANRILETLRRPFTLEGGHEVLIGSSIGITLFPNDAEDVDTLLRNADTAMYRAKASGRNAFQFFTEEMNREIQSHLDLENALRRAVRAMDLTIHYQPVVDSATLAVVSAEALVRWPLADKGFIPPSRFIPVAEELGLIDEIGGWVLWNACTQAKVWQAQGAKAFRVSVNVSWRQLRNPDFALRVREALEGTGLGAAFLELEITEGMVLRDPQGIAPALMALSEMGVALAIDNFGSGHSSIKCLRQFPFSILKLDRSCVADVLTSHEDAVLVETAAIMARRLGLTVVAEGVETHAQLEFLREHYCDLIQGYLFGRPLPPEDFARML
ncbi:putative bifunctional diguanylate cyclase/phosphodiesterase [Rhodospirillum rubrum]|uniref:Diguanylate cyclase/phosphodiesterase n=1 Tax=Rhodospirillum rubrum (strain ATCC 11170 / ATH 1.1.1 / DSM 467 / LMG 4362 / NCIMB 8255 / S1) TaxID=269796 RepID=Q2RWY3_RHORT|nr:bifunctional diguanylate cyclase/phosphodiesterase [Rhodospirillum rubrum]ABC21362.1 diguanylate cyclase/phosphodiesterase [Rhodospirillum rubrum ATCC 11170]MBK5952948.1 GGDEF domain-containing protein [Rhodospirillum rubrum]QXG81040.1 EAL domain-containing protein [Rhodospirillum rubrum]HAQ01516.1 bifunctional diguanylate cyclase/phosphodiesterase [Rhodospirillum rubrum]